MTLSQAQHLNHLSSPSSRTVYRNNSNYICCLEILRLTFEGLLKGDSRLIQSHLIDYIIHLKSSGISGISINTRINSIKKLRGK